MVTCDWLFAVEALVCVVGSKALCTDGVLIFEGESLSGQGDSTFEADEALSVVRLQLVRHSSCFDRLQHITRLIPIKIYLSTICISNIAVARAASTQELMSRLNYQKLDLTNYYK